MKTSLACIMIRRKILLFPTVVLVAMASWFVLVVCPPPGGGGGSLSLEVLPDARESPSEKHPKREFNGMPKDTLILDRSYYTGQFPHPK